MKYSELCISCVERKLNPSPLNRMAMFTMFHTEPMGSKKRIFIYHYIPNLSRLGGGTLLKPISLPRRTHTHRRTRACIHIIILMTQTSIICIYIDIRLSFIYLSVDIYYVYGRIPRTAWYHPQISVRPGSSFSVVTIPTSLALEETKRLLQQCPGFGWRKPGWFHQKCCFFMGFHVGKYGEIWE